MTEAISTGMGTVMRAGMMRRMRAGLAALLAAATAAVASPAPAGAAPAATTCGFADPGSGRYAQTLCWLDLSGYDVTQPGSQPLTVAVPGGYTLHATLTVSGGPLQAVKLPTYSGAYLGADGHYTGVPGKPALYQIGQGSVSTVTLTGITMTDAAGATVTGYSLASADAESTDDGESLTWTSNVPVTQVGDLGTACGGGLTGAGTTNMTCLGRTGPKTGTAIAAAENPASFGQTLRGGGKEAVALGVLLPRVRLAKAVVAGYPGDAFTVAIRDQDGRVLASANTGGGPSASTGITTVLGSTDVTLGEAATSGTLDNYDQSWVCNGVAGRPELPIVVQPGQFVDCTITNTGKPASLSLLKQAGVPVDRNGDGLLDAGDLIPYTFRVTNTGQVPLTALTVRDAKVGAVSCPPGALAPGQAVTCTAGYTLTPDDIAAGAVDNTATATAVPAGTSVTVTSAPSSTHTPLPRLALSKSASPATITRAGEPVTFTFTVTNTGQVPLHDIAVTERAFSGSGKLTAVSCGGGGALAPGARLVCTARYTPTQRDVDAGVIVNSATVTGLTAAGVRAGASAGTVVLAPASPGLSVTKSASPADPADYRVGEAITYSFLVVNTGNVTLRGIQVADTGFGGAGPLSPVTCPRTTLAPGEQVVCTAGYVLTAADVAAGQVANGGAVATGLAPDGSSTASLPSATVLVPQDASGDPGGTWQLAATGSDVSDPALLAAILLAAGALLLLAARRRG